MGLVFLIIGFGLGLFVLEWLEEDEFGFGCCILFIALVLAGVAFAVGCGGIKEEDCVYAVVESRQIVKNGDGYYREMRDEEKEADYYVVMVKDEKGKHECMLKKEDCYTASQGRFSAFGLSSCPVQPLNHPQKDCTIKRTGKTIQKSEGQLILVFILRLLCYNSI